MKRWPFILGFLLLGVAGADRGGAAEAGPVRHQSMECCSKPGDEKCSPERRALCGKRKGDWYGARRAVTTIGDAREQLAKYYSGQKMTVAEVAEKQWRYEADLLDNCGKVVDRVMIDKRSGRIRSIY